MRRLLLLGVAFAFSFAGCGSGMNTLLRDPNPIYLPREQPVSAIREALFTAIPRHGWFIESEEANHIVATLLIRSHMARVLITYDGQRVVVQYIDSENLGFGVDASGNRRIHHNYNRWVTNLVQDIQSALRGSERQTVIVITQ
jgi:hypothetical protein